MVVDASMQFGHYDFDTLRGFVQYCILRCDQEAVNPEQWCNKSEHGKQCQHGQYGEGNNIAFKIGLGDEPDVTGENTKPGGRCSQYRKTMQWPCSVQIDMRISRVEEIHYTQLVHCMVHKNK